jgi:DNA invertase Pin-like site-specific DNA recombinase
MFRKAKRRWKDIIDLRKEYKSMVDRFNRARAQGNNTYAIKRKINNIKYNYSRIKFWFMPELP